MFKVKSYDGKHPNPLFYRENYELLNGKWNFKFDKLNIGIKNKYYNGFKKDYDINVPYDYLSESSGIHILENIKYIWYQKIININELEHDYLLHFEGSDYLTWVYINGKLVGNNEGCYHSFTFNITSFLNKGDNLIVVRCFDDKSAKKPRGKQRFTKNNWMCWYEETQGIYKDVWLEKVEKERITDIKYTPSYINKNVNICIKTNSIMESINVVASYKDKVVFNKTLSSVDNKIDFVIDLKDEFHPWDVLKPELYDFEVKFKNDKVLSYFGIRDIEVSGRNILLNGNKLYQKLILDQGYIEHGNLTLTNEELEFDIKAMINMGFNGARKHQKIESKMFYSLADMYGYLVWLEMPSFMLPCHISRKRMVKEWKIIIDEHYNYPSIINYTPFNESWGIFAIDFKDLFTKHFINSVYDLTKSLDKTRLCLTNDGWCHAKSDFITLHNYEQDANKFIDVIKYAETHNKLKSSMATYVSLYPYDNLPILVDEFGGTSFVSNKEKLFGYGTVNNIDEYKTRLKSLFEVLLNDDRLCGYCYTQLSDVRQEINGLYTMDRKRKIDDISMKEIQHSI